MTHLFAIIGITRAKILVAVLLLSAFSGAPVSAWQVTVNGTTYQLTVNRTTYEADSALLIAQPWWGNETLAEDITARMQTIGINILAETGTESSAAFGFNESGGFVNNELYSGSTAVGNRSFALNNSTPWAIATSVTVAVPEIDGPVLAQVLLILSTGYLFLRGRRLRSA